jgi:hypothetical protein
MLMHRDLRDHLEHVRADMFVRQEAGELFAFLETHLDYAGAKDSNPTELRPLKDFVKIIGLQYEELYLGLEFTELQYEAARLQARLVETFVKTKKQTIAEKLQDSSDDDTRRLLAEAKDLDALLRTINV